MSWKECHVTDERLRFVACLLDGERMTSLCKEFGISRKTGYKTYDRYKAHDLQGLSDRSRRPQRHAKVADDAVAVLSGIGLVQPHVDAVTFDKGDFKAIRTAVRRHWSRLLDRLRCLRRRIDRSERVDSPDEH